MGFKCRVYIWILSRVYWLFLQAMLLDVTQFEDQFVG